MATLRVLVTKTTDFYSSEILSVDDASVTLQYDNEVLTANHIDHGLYTLDIPEITTDKQYQLIVDVDGVSYIAKEELVGLC